MRIWTTITSGRQKWRDISQRWPWSDERWWLEAEGTSVACGETRGKVFTTFNGNYCGRLEASIARCYIYLVPNLVVTRKKARTRGCSEVGAHATASAALSCLPRFASNSIYASRPASRAHGLTTVKQMRCDAIPFQSIAWQGLAAIGMPHEMHRSPLQEQPSPPTITLTLSHRGIAGFYC